MHHVIELHFDPATAHRLDAARQAFFRAGLVDAMPAGVPHISLCSFEAGDPAPRGDVLRSVARLGRFEIAFSDIAVFPGPPAVVYLGVTWTHALRRAQRAAHVQAKAVAADLHRLYHPDRIVPHVTLGAPVSSEEVGRAIGRATTLALPVRGTICRIAWVAYPAGELLGDAALCEPGGRAGADDSSPSTP